MRRSPAIYLLPLLLVAASVAQMVGDPGRYGLFGRAAVPAHASPGEAGPALLPPYGPGSPDLIGEKPPTSGDSGASGDSGPRLHPGIEGLRGRSPLLVPPARPRA